MKKRKQLVFRLSFRYALLLIVSFTMIFLSFYLIMSNALTDERANVLGQRLDNLSEKLNDRIEAIMQLQSGLLRNTHISNALRGSADESAANTVLDGYRASSYLFNSVTLFDAGLNVLGRSEVTLSTADLRPVVEELRQTAAFRSFISRDGRLYFAFALYSDEDYRYLGYGCAEINVSRLFFDFFKSAGDVFSAVYVCDPDVIIARSDRSGLLAKTEDVSAALNPLRENSNYAGFERRNSAYAGWTISAFYDQSRLMRANATQIRILLVIFLFALVTVLLLSILMAGRITRPIKDITRSMSVLETGAFPEPVETAVPDDEIGLLVTGYNHAVRELKKLNYNILVEQQEKQRLEMLSVKTQLELLQSQINPHFIHNTLNTMNFMALREGNDELSDTIVSFNALLRASIGTVSDFCSVAEETEYVRCYMNIQEKRYADREITLSITMDKASRSELLPRLILQPLVENSLFHGVLPNAGRPGVIRVLAMVDDGSLYIYIIDNGVGISDDKLKLIDNNQLPVTNAYSHIGLKNVKERLNLLYRQDCRFTVVSEEGLGTTIFFSLPCRGKEQACTRY